LPEELFYFPYGARSLQRMLLKMLKFPSRVYLQKKSGFDLTNHVLRGKENRDHMKNELRRDSLLNKLLNIPSLKGIDLRNAFNLHILIGLYLN